MKKWTKMDRKGPYITKGTDRKKSHVHSSSICSCEEVETLVGVRSWKDAITREALAIAGRSRVSHRG